MKWRKHKPGSIERSIGIEDSYAATGTRYTYAVVKLDTEITASYRLPILHTRATFLNNEKPYKSIAAAKRACEAHNAEQLQ